MQEFSQALVWWITALGVTSFYLARRLPVFMKSTIRFTVFSSWIVIFLNSRADHGQDLKSTALLVIAIPAGFLIGYGLEKIAGLVEKVEGGEHE